MTMTIANGSKHAFQIIDSMMTVMIISIYFVEDRRTKMA